MINDAGGDVELAYLRFLGENLIVESIDKPLSGILREWQQREGWCSLDGSHGIKLVYVDEWEFGDDFVVEGL